MWNDGQSDDSSLSIFAGLPADVFIKTPKRSLFDSIKRPFVNALHFAVTEE